MAKPRRVAPPQPHDTLFKWTFSQRAHAAGLIRAALPAALVAEIDLRTLRMEKGSYVDRALRSRHSDLVLSARMRRKPLYFYVLVEQQREVEALMVLRMGIYMMRLWEEMVRDRPAMKEIPPILPILLHHSDGGWTAATAFEEIIAADEAVKALLLPYLPRFSMRLIDLGRGRADNLMTGLLTSLGQVVLWAMSVAGDDARLEEEIGRVGAALGEVLQAPDAIAALEVLLRYLAATHERLDAERICDLMEKAAGPEAREVIVTWVDEIVLQGERRGLEKGLAKGLEKGLAKGLEKGLEKGRAEGRAEGRADALLELLAVRFGAVPARARAKVHAADEATLSRWTARVLTASSLAEVLADVTKAVAPTRRPAARRQPRRP